MRGPAPRRLPTITLVLALALTSLATLPNLGVAAVWHVLADGTGDAPTIQAAIDSTAGGDTVLVGPGTYSESLESVGTDICLLSELGPDVTVLDGTGLTAPILTIHSGDDVVVKGLTFTQSSAHPAIFADHQAHLHGNRFVGNGSAGGPPAVDNTKNGTIEDNEFSGNLSGAYRGAIGGQFHRNIFRDNHSTGNGGAILLTGGNATIADNAFFHNSAAEGGAIYLQASQFSMAIMDRNLYVGNAATAGGGGAVYSQWSMFVRNSTFDDNSCTAACGGGAIGAPGVFFNTVKNIFSNNVGCAIDAPVSAQPNDNCFWQNTPSTTSDTLGDQIVADPLYCDAPGEDFCLFDTSPAAGLGVCPEPTCTAVPVEPTTWGRLKSVWGTRP